MPEITIRPAARNDLPRLTEIYNYYVIHTPVTFDIEPYTVEKAHCVARSVRRDGPLPAPRR